VKNFLADSCQYLYSGYILGMNDVVAKGVEVVRMAEASLRELIQTAVNDGQYDHVATLARLAEQLAQIRNNDWPKGTAKPEAAGVATVNLAAPVSSRKVRKVAKRGKKRRKSNYPTFKRIGDSLVKIAWSKATKSEYQHQAPKDVAVSLLRKMQEFSHHEELLAMDAILPLSTADGEEVPAYQSYSCLAWLREIGLVQQHGRRGYTVLADAESTRLIEKSWNELPIHRS
jgi:hypothetical protein